MAKEEGGRPEPFSAKNDFSSLKLKKEYLEILRAEIDDTFDKEEKLALLKQYIPIGNDIYQASSGKDKKGILAELLYCYRHMLDVTPDLQERKKIYQEIKKLVIPEIQ